MSKLSAFDLAHKAGKVFRSNPSGLDALAYRGATYQNALSRMLVRLSYQTSGQGESTRPPLAHLNVEADDDWAVALLHAWAVVTDVLSFYEERILNEGFLRTAKEPRSVLELARLIGYELHPGTSASTSLAVTVQTGHNEPSRRAAIPAGTAVQGLQPDGQLPLVFETDISFEARSEWNRLKLANRNPAGTVWPLANTLLLAENRPDLQAGSLILILGEDGSGSRKWLLAELTAVQSEPDNAFTRVTWQGIAGKPDLDGPLHHARVFPLRPLGKLHGYSQTAVDFVPLDGKHPRPAGIGLPKVEVHALASTRAGTYFAGTAQDVFRSTDNGASWQPAATGPLQQNVTALLVDDRDWLYAGTERGGIYVSQDEGHHWAQMSGEGVARPPRGFKKWLPFLFDGPLPRTTVRCLAAHPQGGRRVLFAGTDDGVYRSLDLGSTWQPSNFNMPELDWKTGQAKTVGRSLGAVKRGAGFHVFAGLQEGVFRVTTSQRFWPLLVQNLFLLLAVRILWAREGVVKLILDWLKGWVDWLKIQELPAALQKIVSLKDTFEPVGAALDKWLGVWPNLLPDPWGVLNTPLIFLVDFLLVTAAAALGLVLATGIRRWVSRLPAKSLGKPVYALGADENGRLFAGTTQGVFRSGGPNLSQKAHWLLRLLTNIHFTLLPGWIGGWQRIGKPDEIQDVRALTATPSGNVLAGTADGTLFRSGKNSEDWVRLDHSESLEDIQAVLATRQGLFGCGTPSKEKTERRWSLSQIVNRQVDLDRADAPIAPQDWLVLRQAGDPERAMLYQVVTAANVNNPDYNSAGQKTRLEVDTDIDLDTFDREISTAWVGDRPLLRYDEDPVSGDRFTIDHIIPGLGPGHRLIFCGKRPRARLVKPSEDLAITSADGLAAAPLVNGEVLSLIALPGSVHPDGLVEWPLRNSFGFIGVALAAEDTFVIEHADQEDETIAEEAVIRSAEIYNQASRITLCSPLKNVYDRIDLVVYGNVVPATHRRTVRDEVLGSGDGSQAFQGFRLRQKPLSFISAPTARGAKAALEVKVNGVLWHEAPSFQGLAKDSRAYILRQDAKGNACILFGDGEHGARLPSGYEHVRASYGVGLGPEGNIPPGSLNQLQSSVAGLEGVTNPIPATGGSGPESGDWTRQNAPTAARTIQRIVSLSDYEDFVRCYSGVGKAQARLLHTGSQEILHITIAGPAGEMVPEESNLHRMLVQAIQDNRGRPHPPFIVDSYEALYFNFQARLLIAPDHRERQQDIEADVRKRIARRFGYSAREFGQDASGSELIHLMQQVPGVTAVQLIHFHYATEQPRLASTLDAHPARRHEGRLLPAQMLLANIRNGIQLNLEVVP